MKKILLSFGALTVIAAPIVTVVSCNEESGSTLYFYNSGQISDKNPNGDSVDGNNEFSDFGLGFEVSGDKLNSISIYFEEGHQVAGHEYDKGADAWTGVDGRPNARVQAALLTSFSMYRKDVCMDAEDSPNYVRAISIEFGGTSVNGNSVTSDIQKYKWSNDPRQNVNKVPTTGDLKKFNNIVPIFVLPYSKA